MMNKTLEELYNRKSVRAFTEQEISREDKDAILLAAANAPTAGNQQMYTIIDVTDQSLKDKLAVSCDNQPFIAKGEMLLVFCADFQKWYDAFKVADSNPRKVDVGNMLLATEDTMIAAQNAVVAAESLGIGSCYIGDILEKYEYHKELLNLPRYVFPVALLVFGYPTQQQIDRPKPARVPMKHIVHENSYRRMDADELKEMFSGKTGKMSYEEYIKAFYERKYDTDFSKEMGRSVCAMIDGIVRGDEDEKL